MRLATPSAPTAPTTMPTRFEELVDTATRGRDYRQTRSFALDHGFDETALVQYATGAVAMYERKEIEAMITKCEWARRFVVEHIKKKRQKRSAA